MAGGARMLAVPDAFAQPQQQPLFAKFPLVGQLLLQFPPAGVGIGRIEAFSRFRIGPGLIQEIGDPATDRFHVDLGAFLLQKSKHVEVAVTFGELCPKLTRDLDDGLYARAIYFDLVQTLTGDVHNFEEVLAVEVIQNLAQRVEDIFEFLVPRQAFVKSIPACARGFRSASGSPGNR